MIQLDYEFTSVYHKYTFTTMNISKYRKLYLQENWKENKFTTVTAIRLPFNSDNDTIFNDFEFWSNPGEICVGFVMRSNRNIYRPLFSPSRQEKLNKAHVDITCIPSKFWNNVRTKYFRGLWKLNLPIDAVNYIISFIVIPL
jgi:hypothetical protein